MVNRCLLFFMAAVVCIIQGKFLVPVHGMLRKNIPEAVILE